MDDTFDWRINNRSGRYTDVNAKMYGSFLMTIKRFIHKFISSIE